MCKHATHSLALFKNKYKHVLVLALTHTYTHYLSFYVFPSISGFPIIITISGVA